MTQELKERNHRIYRYWQKSQNYRQTAIKFGLDVGYIWRLVKRYRKQESK